jgi:hypothetical protein
MFKKKNKIKACFECQNCYWYDDLKSFVCSLNNRKVIYGIETIQPWCSLPSKFLKKQKANVSFYY